MSSVDQPNSLRGHNKDLDLYGDTWKTVGRYQISRTEHKPSRNKSGWPAYRKDVWELLCGRTPITSPIQSRQVDRCGGDRKQSLVLGRKFRWWTQPLMATQTLFVTRWYKKLYRTLSVRDFFQSHGVMEPIRVTRWYKYRRTRPLWPSKPYSLRGDTKRNKSKSAWSNFWNSN